MAGAGHHTFYRSENFLHTCKSALPMKFLRCLHKGNLHNLRGHLVVQGWDQESRGPIDHMGLGCCSLLHSVKYTCFSKVPKFLGPTSGATIPVISSQRRGSKPSNFAALLVFHTLQTCWKISFSKQVDCTLTNGFPGPKKSRDFRETGSSTHM